MKTKIHAQFVFSPLIVVALLLNANSLFAAEAEKTIAPLPVPLPSNCPSPINQTFDANMPYALQSDFTSVQWNNHIEALNYTGTNKQYLHTFRWKPQSYRCCQCISAVLTVKMESNSAGLSKDDDSDAGNDHINVMRNGVLVTPYSEYIYSNFPFPAHTPVTKQLHITGDALNNMCNDNRLSFVVQDDTKVLGATLQLKGCCLTIK